MFKKTLLGGALLCLFLSASAEEPDHAIHEELRGVLKTLTSAINSGDYDKMLPVLSQQIRATPINQEFLASHAEVSEYFKRWFGPGGYLKKLDITLEPDASTELSQDRSWGVAYGKGVERYILSDGRPYDLYTRWTATMAKEDDGRWRVRALHIGTNFLDNAILTEAEHALGKVAIGGVGAGLLIGAALGWFLGRRKKKG